MNETNSIVNYRIPDNGNYTIKEKVILKPQYHSIWIDDYIEHSQFLTKLRLYLSTPISNELAAINQTESVFADKSNVLITNIKLIELLSEYLGAEFYVCLQPTLIKEGLSIENREKLRLEYLNLDFDDALKAYETIYQAIIANFKESKIIDLRSMNGNGDYFYDHVHVNEKGAEIYAEYVSKAILK